MLDESNDAMASDRSSQPAPPHGDDAALTRRAAAGDERAQRQLVERLLPRVRSTVHYLAGGHRDADDLVQNSLVGVLRAAGGYRGDASLERWADRIAVRTALRGLRQRRKRDQLVSLTDQLPEHARRTEGDLQRRALRKRLAQLLERLSPDRRAVVVLHWVRGYTIPEIAELLDTSPHTVRDRLHVGKRKLKKWICKDPVLRDWATAFQDEP